MANFAHYVKTSTKPEVHGILHCCQITSRLAERRADILKALLLHTDAGCIIMTVLISQLNYKRAKAGSNAIPIPSITWKEIEATGGEGRIRDRMVRRIGGRERKVRKRKMRGKGEMEVSGRDLLAGDSVAEW